VPFVAGVGKMSYAHFITYNIAGGFAWTYAFTYAGFKFGELPFVQRNFKLVIIAIILISVIPILVEFIRAWREARRRKPV
jgi:membrane-associated protein